MDEGGAWGDGAVGLDAEFEVAGRGGGVSGGGGGGGSGGDDVGGGEGGEERRGVESVMMSVGVRGEGGLGKLVRWWDRGCGMMLLRDEK